MTSRAQRQARVAGGPFVRLVDVTSVPASGLDLTIEATPDECSAVAAATDLPALRSLQARVSVTPRAGGRYAVSGSMEAEIAEQCVVTLDPFESRVEQPIDLLFAPAVAAPVDVKGRGRHARSGREREASRPAPVPGRDDQADPPDPIIDDLIDLGSMVVEFLTLARDPYPRKPDARFEDVVGAQPVDAPPSAFAALDRLKGHS